MHTHTHTHNYVIKRNPIPLSEGHSSQLGPTISSLRLQIFFFYILSYFSNGNLIFFCLIREAPSKLSHNPILLQQNKSTEKNLCSKTHVTCNFLSWLLKRSMKNFTQQHSQRAVTAVGPALVTG